MSIQSLAIFLLDMRVITKYTFLFLFFFSTTIGVLAQNILWETYSESGKQAYGNGNYVEAERLFKTALKEAENLQNGELIARSNDFLGGLYFQQQKYDDAEKFFLKAVETWEQLGAKDADEITYPLSNLGLLYSEQKKYVKAEEVLRRAITIREKTNNPDIAAALLNLGKVYAEQKELIKAQVVCEKAFEIFLLSKDLNTEGVIYTLNNLTLTYEETKNYKKLEPAYRVVIDIIGKNYGMNDLGLVTYLEKYAALLRTLKRNTEAAKIEARAKRIRQLNKR